jgi:hypothetical protein
VLVLSIEALVDVLILSVKAPIDCVKTLVDVLVLSVKAPIDCVKTLGAGSSLL